MALIPFAITMQCANAQLVPGVFPAAARRPNHPSGASSRPRINMPAQCRPVGLRDQLGHPDPPPHRRHHRAPLRPALTRVVRLTIDDVLHDGETALLRFGEPASPIPAPVASPLREYIAGCANMTTATNPASRWLFPGRRAGRPCRAEHLSALLGQAGVPASAARGAAIRQQLLKMPAPVVAGALGYPDKTATRLLNEAGSQWSRYAAGDHAKSLPPRQHPQLATAEYASPPGWRFGSVFHR
jgi:hypothetical protein